MDKYFENIEAYCDGLLKGNELKEFEIEIANNIELKQAIEAYLADKEMAKGLLEMDILESINDAKANPPVQLNPIPPKQKNWYVWGPIIAIALGLLIGFLSKVMGHSKSSIEQMYAENYSAPVWPGTKSSADQQLNQAILKYIDQDQIEEAKENILKISTLDLETQHYWIAEMYMEQQVFDSVRVYLPKVDENFPYKHRVDMMKKILSVE